MQEKKLRPSPASTSARIAASAAILLAAAACSSSDDGPRISDRAVAVMLLQNVNTQAHACWLPDPAFKAYGIVPELDTTGTPRLLVVPRGKPRALPQLVIAAQGTSMQAFGPLASSPLSGRISADLSRWMKGARGCVA